MLVSLSSGNYDIIASGQAFLFSKDEDFRIDIQEDHGFVYSITLNFVENESSKQEVQVNSNDNQIMHMEKTWLRMQSEKNCLQARFVGALI